jgi:hypothetical protein
MVSLLSVEPAIGTEALRLKSRNLNSPISSLKKGHRHERAVPRVFYPVLDLPGQCPGGQELTWVLSGEGTAQHSNRGGVHSGIPSAGVMPLEKGLQVGGPTGWIDRQHLALI